MKQAFSYLIICLISCFSASGQGFNLKEILSFKDHDITFFHDFVKQKGYSYEKSKYDEKNENYAYVFLPDIVDNLHEITYTKKGKEATITFGTTDVSNYEQIKRDMELLQFKFVKFVPKQQHGRSVLMIVYTDGTNMLNLYNSYMEDANKHLVRFYKVKVY